MAASLRDAGRWRRSTRSRPAPVLDCVSWSLRYCLKATDDSKVLWSFDFSQIEARVLAWLAGQQDMLAVFAAGDDVYVWAAGQFGLRPATGKVLVLALGFGMGATKLRETALKSYGVRLTAAQAEKFKGGVAGARTRKIVQFWSEMDFAAKSAILNRGQVFAVGGSGVAFVCTARTLQMRLPSGRVLYYHKPRLEQATRKHRLLGGRGRRALGRTADVGRKIGRERHAGGGPGHHERSDAQGLAAGRKCSMQYVMEPVEGRTTSRSRSAPRT